MASRKNRQTRRNQINKKIKIKQTNKRKIKQKNKISKKLIGGRYVNAGAEGVLYNAPRPPCNNETIDQISGLVEIGKLFPDEYTSSADAEIYASSILSEISEISEINASQYFVIPVKKCKINKDLLKMDPYNKSKWRTNGKGEFNNRIFKNADEELPANWNDMVVYPLGEMDLYDILSEGISFFQFCTLLKSFTNVLEGVKLLQDNNLFYGDFSIENILLIDNTFKIADIGNIQEINHNTKMKLLPYTYYKYMYPSIAALTYCFLPSQPPTITGYKVTEAKQIKLSIKLLKKLYDDSLIKVSINAQDNYNINNRFIDTFIITVDMGFTEKQIERVTKIKTQLLQQKFFGFLNLDEYILYLKKSKQEQEQEPLNILPYMNAIYNSVNVMKSVNDIEKMEIIKKDLLKRIDLYSIGIIILNIVNIYIVSTPNTEKINHPDLIVDLYTKIVFLCCNQMTQKCADIYDVILEYTAIIQEMDRRERSKPTKRKVIIQNENDIPQNKTAVSIGTRHESI